MHSIKIKRIYEPYESDDGYRVLVDRLWPRGISKSDAKLDEWAKDQTPSNELRTGLHNGELVWEVFASLFAKQLEESDSFEAWKSGIKEKLKTQDITFLTAAKLEPHNHVEVLKDLVLR